VAAGTQMSKEFFLDECGLGNRIIATQQWRCCRAA
jgi:hypothetical protein